MLEYLVLNEDGNEVNEGDFIKDFRGGTSVFVKVARGVEYNGMALVTVREVDGRPGRIGDYYASVYNLKVQTKCGVQGCGSVDHSTRDHGAELRH
jgi:hypothetical protein